MSNPFADSHASHSTTTDQGTTDHSSGGGGHSTIFQTMISTSLFSSAFTPKNQGQYAGAVIFLIVLTVVYRGLAAYKSTLEHQWEHRSRSTVVLIAGKNDGEEGVIEKAKEETQTSQINGGKRNMPFRLSTEVPRAALGALNAGLGYLIMLAVMTMNVGYFMAVLAGYFIGDLLFGRFIKGESH